MQKAIAAALEESLGQPVTITGRHGVGGGCINETALFKTTAGDFFVKWNANAPADMFECESEALTLMLAAESGLVIPEPVCYRRRNGDTAAFLVMEYLPTGSKVSDFDERLGRGLAQLHRASTDQFGFEHDNYCGLTPQSNGWMDNWAQFYKERRLEWQLQLIAKARGLSNADAKRYRLLFDRLDELLATDPEPPALIHGDLWGGNLHVTADGTPGLIDPAANYAHREAELGMMVLFGGFGSRVFDAYHEAWPLQPGWRDRLPLYSLYHVMNHYYLFGGGYGEQALAIVTRYV